MSNRLQRWLVEELMKPVVFIGTLVGKVASPLLLPRAIRRSLEGENQLIGDIRRELPFLFDRYGGEVVPDERQPHPRPFDYAIVFVAVDDLIFRFSRGRGDLSVNIAQKNAPNDWDQLHLVLSLIDDRDIAEPLFWTDIARLLESHMESLKEAFSENSYPDFQRRLSAMRERERAAMRQREIEINRRLGH